MPTYIFQVCRIFPIMSTNRNALQSYHILSNRKLGLLCQFIIKENFSDGNIYSDHYHFHSTYEVHVAIKGQTNIMIEDDTILLNEGDICIIPPDTVHYVYKTEDSHKTGFRFTFSALSKHSAELYKLFEHSFGSVKDYFIIKNHDIYKKYLSVACDLASESVQDFVIAEMLFLSLYEIATVMDGTNEIGDHEENHSLIILSERIEEFISANYNRKLYLEELADHLHLSKRQTERIIKKIFNTSFNELLNKKRLMIAKFMLKNTTLAVDEISQQLAFADKSYFYHKFREAFSVTPGTYRKNANK